MMNLKPEPAPASFTDYARALHDRDTVIRDWERLFQSWDVFICPVVPVTAFPHCPPGTPLDIDGTAVESWRIDHFLYPFNFTGHPSLSMPAALDRHGLPIGVQLVGRRWADEELLASARAVDEVVAGYQRPPELA
jgi:amidase